MTTRADIVAEARAWLGTPWLHQARLKGVGTDCIGLIGGVALALGLPGAAEWDADPTLHCYGRTPDPRVLLGGCNRFMDRIAVEEVLPADVLIMSFEKEPQHFAIVSRIDPMYVVHAYAQRGRVVENGVQVAGARVQRAYRYRGVEA